jgi:hypothetical protein
MEKRCCKNCVYATPLCGRWLRIIMWGWAGLRVCFNSAANPGRLQEVYPTGWCWNFCPRRDERRPGQPAWLPGPSRRSEETRLIPLKYGLHVIVDAADYEWLSRYKWFLCGAGYAARHAPGKTIFMHREIMQAPPGMVVDHINGNRMDNRRSNLRICTRPENLRNAAKRSGCLSLYKGVSFDCKMNQWFATIWFEGRSIALGHYHDEVDAARAYDRAAVELFGEFAWLNFPQELEARRQEIAAHPQNLTDKPKRRKPTDQPKKPPTPKPTTRRKTLQPS